MIYGGPINTRVNIRECQLFFIHSFNCFSYPRGIRFVFRQPLSLTQQTEYINSFCFLSKFYECQAGRQQNREYCWSNMQIDFIRLHSALKSFWYERNRHRTLHLVHQQHGWMICDGRNYNSMDQFVFARRAKATFIRDQQEENGFVTSLQYLCGCRWQLLDAQTQAEIKQSQATLCSVNDGTLTILSMRRHLFAVK